MKKISAEVLENFKELKKILDGKSSIIGQIEESQIEDIKVGKIQIEDKEDKYYAKIVIAIRKIKKRINCNTRSRCL
jgi:hypothetical protein